jgi:uncharacterized protein (UPF0332 family)
VYAILYRTASFDLSLAHGSRPDHRQRSAAARPVIDPESVRLIESARERIASARSRESTAAPAVLVEDAYYSMLSAARAAVSEAGDRASSEEATWTLFEDRYVWSGRLDGTLFAAARESRLLHETRPFDGPGSVPPANLSHLLDDAGRFVDAVEAALPP